MPKFERRAAERPLEIQAAALRCFASRGFAATTVAEVAAEAGVSAGTIYRYFPSKEALMEALAVGGVDAGWSRGREIAEAYGSRTAREVVALLLGRWLDHLEQPGPAALLRVMARESTGFPRVAEEYGQQLLKSGQLPLERALRHGIARGEFPLLQVEVSARSLAVAVLGAATWQVALGGGGMEPSRQAITALVRGLPSLRDGPVSAPTEVAAAAEPPLGEISTTGAGLRIVTLSPPVARRTR